MTESPVTTEPTLHERIEQAYINHVLEHGQEPATVYSFMQKLGLSEADFYAEFGSFDAIDKAIWMRTITRTFARLKEDETYVGYSVREKLLSFYYVWIEELTSIRSFIQYSYRKAGQNVYVNGPTKAIKNLFKQYANELVAEGLEKGELQQRTVLSEGYADALWLQLLFVLNFWLKDDTARFERTDAAIEKAVNLSLDIMGRNTLDSAIDFVKFLFQRR